MALFSIFRLSNINSPLLFFYRILICLYFLNYIRIRPYKIILLGCTATDTWSQFITFNACNSLLPPRFISNQHSASLARCSNEIFHCAVVTFWCALSILFYKVYVYGCCNGFHIKFKLTINFQPCQASNSYPVSMSLSS